MIATTRALQRLICRLLIGVLLTTQLAIAAYACPTVVGPALPAATALPAPARGADTDPALAPLCDAHCQPAEQRGESQPAPQTFPALLVSLYLLAPPAAAAGQLTAAALSPPHGPPVAADPPHRTLHCCLRD